ncbi:MAG TPA: energy transducer TonB [Flavilitoribacter sp.]|nr:energy transducer TonB [Flavilitoribacter sp.]HMQ87124.1 energy transducer TonB [Flavilitoribacter sp.]
MKTVFFGLGLVLSLLTALPTFGQMQPLRALYQEAEYPGGNEALQKHFKRHLRYPVSAIDKEVTGRFTVTFRVAPTGEIHDIKVLNCLDESLIKATKKAIKAMPDWLPAFSGEEPVESDITLIFRFELHDAL